MITARLQACLLWRLRQIWVSARDETIMPVHDKSEIEHLEPTRKGKILFRTFSSLVHLFTSLVDGKRFPVKICVPFTAQKNVK